MGMSEDGKGRGGGREENGGNEVKWQQKRRRASALGLGLTQQASVGVG